jgi:hypothetical protein
MIDYLVGRKSELVKNRRLYLWMRNGIMGGTMNLPGRGGRKISVEGYKICQKLFGFN